MKFSCYKSDLTEALQFVIRAVAVKPMTPILAGIYLKAEGSMLEIQSNNFSTGIITRIPVNTEISGETVVSGKRFQEFVKNMPDDTITFYGEDGDNFLTIESGGASVELLTMPASDFPKVKTPETEKSFKIRTTTLRDLIRKTVFAVAKENDRPIFTGGCFEIKGDKISLVATNTHRLALVSLSIVPGMEYKYNVALFHEFKTQFKAMTLATPLMYWQGQEEQPDDVMQVMQSLHLPAYKKGTAILLMAHGTPDPSNAYYSVMQAKLRAMKRNDVHIYTVEGWPRLDDWAGKLKMHKVEKIILIPFMLVAGDHANNDMAGNEDDSHKVILEKMGFKVEAKLQGLGESKKIRDIFVERANEAWDALVK